MTSLLALDPTLRIVAVLGPRAVVVTHAWITQKLTQDEPRMCAPSAALAVGDDLLVRGEARSGV